MTMPAEPAKGTPAPGTGDPSQQPATPPGDDPGKQPATGDDWASTFEGLTPEQVKEKLDHARRWESRAKTNKQKLDDLQGKGKQPDPEGGEDWQAKYEAEQQRASEAEERALKSSYRETVRTVATTVSADADALLDSQSFMDAVGEELDEDFDEDDLREAVTKVAAEFAKKPRFAAGGTAPARGGADLGGGAPAPARHRPSSLHGAIKGALGG